MTFLDQRIRQVVAETAINLFMSRIGVPMAVLCDKIILLSLSIPVSVASKMSTLVNNAEALKSSWPIRRQQAPGASMRFQHIYSS